MLGDIIIIIIIALYAVIGLVYAQIRQWLITSGRTWSVARFLDELDYVDELEGRDHALKWNWLAGLCWPIPLVLNLVGVVVLTLCLLLCLVIPVSHR